MTTAKETGNKDVSVKVEIFEAKLPEQVGARDPRSVQKIIKRLECVD